MQEQSQRNFRLRPWGVVLLGWLALSALVEVVGAASLPATIRGIQDERMAGAARSGGPARPYAARPGDDGSLIRVPDPHL
jgi:hypothetical protein